MVLKNVFIAICCALFLGWSGVSIADEYRPDQFLGLDLSKAVLSPKRLGPQAEFEPVPVEARSDGEGAQARAEPTSEPRLRIHESRLRIHESRLRIQKPRVAEQPAAQPAVKPRAAARTKLAHHHRNPLDAQASDTRIQVWPCKSGGICKWKH